MKTKHNTLAPLPLHVDKARYQKLLVKAEHYVEESQKILQQFPSSKIIYILKLREAFLSLYTQGMDIDLEKVCELQIKKKSTSLFIKRIKNHMQAIQLIEKVNKKTAFDGAFWKKLHALVEKDFNKIKEDVGHIRGRQNWIGPKDCTIEEAFFLPPSADKVHSLLKELSSYINKEEEPLLQLGITFAQFLGIHPFMDGNGRIARLIPAALMKKKGKLNSAILYLSDYFLFHRLEYLKNLHYLTMKKDWDKWLSFYCRALEEESYKLSLRLHKLDILYRSIDKALAQDLSHSERKKTLLFLFEHPVFTLAHLKKKVTISPSLIKKCLRILIKKKTITKKGSSLFIVRPLLKIAQKKRSPAFKGQA